jgi:hypothetical protein
MKGLDTPVGVENFVRWCDDTLCGGILTHDMRRSNAIGRQLSVVAAVRARPAVGVRSNAPPCFVCFPLPLLLLVESSLYIFCSPLVDGHV